MQHVALVRKDYSEDGTLAVQLKQYPSTLRRYGYKGTPPVTPVKKPTNRSRPHFARPRPRSEPRLRSRGPGVVRLRLHSHKKSHSHKKANRGVEGAITHRPSSSNTRRRVLGNPKPPPSPPLLVPWKVIGLDAQVSGVPVYLSHPAPRWLAVAGGLLVSIEPRSKQQELMLPPAQSLPPTLVRAVTAGTITSPHESSKREMVVAAARQGGGGGGGGDVVEVMTAERKGTLID